MLSAGYFGTDAWPCVTWATCGLHSTYRGSPAPVTRTSGASADWRHVAARCCHREARISATPLQVGYRTVMVCS
jgi:hypothetical protein